MENGKSENKRFHFLSRKIQFPHFGEPTTPEAAKFLLNHKIIKNEKQAAYIFYGIIFACYAVVAIYFYRTTFLANRVILKNGQSITVEQYADGLRHGLYK